MEFQRFTVKEYSRLEPYFHLRVGRACEEQILSQYIWKELYDTSICIEEEVAYLRIKSGTKYYYFLPFCKEEKLSYYLSKLKSYVNETLNDKLRLYLVEEKYLESLDLREEEYNIVTNVDWEDYVYDYEKLAKLSGKKYHKKKNHVNAFLKQYEGRYEYATLTIEHKQEIEEFLIGWYENKVSEDAYMRLDNEAEGLKRVLNHLSQIKPIMAGIYIDGVLQAFTMGSYNKDQQMAMIHIEKANDKIRGLYPFINQQFLLHEMEGCKYVNREDDMGLLSLRKAKESYHPIEKVKKYMVIQR